MKATKNMPPMVRPWAPAAAKVSFQDMKRNGVYFNVNLLDTPSNFFGPKGPADPSGLASDMRYQRLLTAISMKGDERALQNATSRIFEIIHFDATARDEDGNVNMSESVLVNVARGAGFDAQEAKDLVGRDIASTAVKAKLREVTNEAIDLGAFGAPFFVIKPHGAEDTEEQVYFGSDRFEQMACVNGWPWVGPDPARPIARV